MTLYIQHLFYFFAMFTEIQCLLHVLDFLNECTIKKYTTPGAYSNLKYSPVPVLPGVDSGFCEGGFLIVGALNFCPTTPTLRKNTPILLYFCYNNYYVQYFTRCIAIARIRVRVYAYAYVWIMLVRKRVYMY